MLLFIQQLFGFKSPKEATDIESAISKGFETDEDKQMDRLEVHRDCIGWLIAKLEKSGIRCERTTGNSPKGDIHICDPNDIPKVREVIREMQAKYNPSK